MAAFASNTTGVLGVVVNAAGSVAPGNVGTQSQRPEAGMQHVEAHSFLVAAWCWM